MIFKCFPLMRSSIIALTLLGHVSSSWSHDQHPHESPDAGVAEPKSERQIPITGPTAEAFSASLERYRYNSIRISSSSNPMVCPITR